jgi:uncharacterized protein YlxW (UPF0749 family)
VARLPRPWLTRRPSAWSLLVPVVGLGAGLLFATSAATAQGTNLRSSGPTDLADVIRAQTREAAGRANALQQLRSQVEQLTAQAAPGNSALKALQEQADRLAPVTGTAAVHGPAITVTLNDAKRTAASLPAGFTADDIVVHQQDVQGVVNALWAGGAEAMMLQDQRVISTSAVRCVGNTLILQGRVYSPPYRIRAIGDVQGMQQSLDRDGSVGIYRQYVDVLGLGYDVQTSPDATFPAYNGSVTLRYAAVPR